MPVIDFLTKVNSIFNLLAPGAFSFEVPVALSSKLVSSVEVINDSSTERPTL